MVDETEITEESEAKEEDDQGEAERGLLPDPEEVEERSFRKLVRQLDAEDVREEYEGKEEAVKDAEDHLVEQFRSTFRFYVLKRIIPIMVGAVALGVLVNRFVQPVPLQAYGIVANVVASTILALNTFQGRYMIARASLPQENQTTLRKAYARQTAVTTSGLAAFGVGFGIQLIGVLW
ncbi:MAG: hypothetical protein R6V31_08645 [Halohasta sp.]